MFWTEKADRIVSERSVLMEVREIRAKSVLSVSGVYDYVVNPYRGCEHGCTYCYARFMKRFTVHKEPWGEFVDVKVNAADVLEAEVRKKRKGRVWVSGVCDPYQPLEATYRLSRRCLEILVENEWPVIIQTRSPLVVRDSDLIGKTHRVEVGLSVTTGNDRVRKIFEPAAPSIAERIDALDKLHRGEARTYAMIAPLLPGAESLPALLQGKVDYVLVDRMNYNYATRIYRKHGFLEESTGEFFDRTSRELLSSFRKLGIDCHIVRTSA
jgi:DNA repair photolyase